MDGVIIELLCLCGYTLFISAGFGLGFHTFLKVGLRIPYHFTYEFCKFCSVLGLLYGYALVSLRNLGITFPISLTAHCKVHPNFTAFSRKVIL